MEVDGGAQVGGGGVDGCGGAELDDGVEAGHGGQAEVGRDDAAVQQPHAGLLAVQGDGDVAVELRRGVLGADAEGLAGEVAAQAVVNFFAVEEEGAGGEAADVAEPTSGACRFDLGAAEDDLGAARTGGICLFRQQWGALARVPGQAATEAAAAGVQLELGGAEASEREQGEATSGLEREQGPVAALGGGAGVEHGGELGQLRLAERRAVVAHDAAAAREHDLDLAGAGAGGPAHELGGHLPRALQLRDGQLAQLGLNVDAQEVPQVDGLGVAHVAASWTAARAAACRSRARRSAGRSRRSAR